METELASLGERIRQNAWVLLALTVAAVLAVVTGLPPIAVLAVYVGLVALSLYRTPIVPPAAAVPPLPVVEASPSSLPEDETRRLVEALDFPVLVINAQEEILLQNAAAVALFGALPERAHISARLRAPGLLDMVREGMANGTPAEKDYVERVPTARAFRVRVAPLSSGRFLITFNDVSGLRRIDQMRTDFVANASHELRTPLASLRGFIETLQGPARADPKAQERFLAIMLDQVTRMSRLVDDLLSLSRLELKSHRAPEGLVDLVPLIAHVRDSLMPLATRLGVTVSLELPEGPAMVSGERDELVQVFENLIENACKYGQEGKTVEVGIAAPDGGPVEVTVTDHGPGIEPEHVPRLTERFYRVNVEASRSKKGTGLGLAIVKHILTRHRARLLIHSEPGRGSRFTVRF